MLNPWKHPNQCLREGWKEGRKESEWEEKRGREFQNRESSWQRPILKYMNMTIWMQRTWVGVSSVSPIIYLTFPFLPRASNLKTDWIRSHLGKTWGEILRWTLIQALTLTLTLTEIQRAEGVDFSEKPKEVWSSEGWECRLRNHKGLTLYPSSASYYLKILGQVNYFLRLSFSPVR